MKILIIGSGGREHALAWKIAQSPKAGTVYSSVAAAAGGKVRFNTADISSIEKIIAFSQKHSVDLVVVGPEAPLAKGLADDLRAEGIAVFGPVRAGAKLEYSKEYSKQFMQKYKIPTAAYQSFTEIAPARDYVKQAALPVVIKADGLAAGKGVRICATTEEALECLSDFMELNVLKQSTNKVVVEEFLEGHEASIMAFVDGNTYQVLPISRDHKRLLDKNRGPNTGGMGVYSPVADIHAEDIDFVKKHVFENVIKGLKAENVDYCGIIYAGIMKGPQGINVLEFNCRFGDPETQTVLPLLEQDLLEVLLACTQKKLHTLTLSTRANAALCVVLAGKDYPQSPSKGEEIDGLEKAGQEALIFHAGTKVENGKVYTNGGRVLGVVACGPDLKQARIKAYRAIADIRFNGMQYRKDIGEDL